MTITMIAICACGQHGRLERACSSRGTQVQPGWRDTYGTGPRTTQIFLCPLSMSRGSNARTCAVRADNRILAPCNCFRLAS